MKKICVFPRKKKKDSIFYQDDFEEPNKTRNCFLSLALHRSPQSGRKSSGGGLALTQIPSSPLTDIFLAYINTASKLLFIFTQLVDKEANGLLETESTSKLSFSPLHYDSRKDFHASVGHFLPAPAQRPGAEPKKAASGSRPHCPA